MVSPDPLALSSRADEQYRLRSVSEYRENIRVVVGGNPPGRARANREKWMTGGRVSRNCPSLYSCIAARQEILRKSVAARLARKQLCLQRIDNLFGLGEDD